MKSSKANAPRSVAKQKIAFQKGKNPAPKANDVLKRKKKRAGKTTTVKVTQQLGHHVPYHRDPLKVQPKDLVPLYLQKTAVGTVNVPHEMHKGIHTVLQGVPRDTLKKEGTALSDTLRARTTTRKSITTIHFANNNPSAANQTVQQVATDVIPPINYTEGRSLAYTAHRMPGVFACTYRVLNEVRSKLPDYAPKSMLDFGSGPGTTIWVASRVWPDSIKNTLAVEPASPMIDVAQKMFAVDDSFQSMSLQWRRFLFAADEGQKFDLVTAGYVLSELKDNKERKEFAKNLWDATEPGGTLVFIEPGTPIGFEIIKMVRTLILSEPLATDLEAQIIGPVCHCMIYTDCKCPHVFACPMQGKSWCHFIQRAQRIPLTLGAKLGSSQNWEDEKYSYISFHKKLKTQASNTPTKPANAYEGEEEIVSVGKSPLRTADADTKWSRIISPPIKRGGHIIMDFCTDDGRITRETVSKSLGNAIYKAARKSSWGDAFNLDAREDAEKDRLLNRQITSRNKAVQKALARRQHEERASKHKKVEYQYSLEEPTESDSHFEITSKEVVANPKQTQLQMKMDQQMNKAIKQLPADTLIKMIEKMSPNKGSSKSNETTLNAKPSKETKQKRGTK